MDINNNLSSLTKSDFYPEANNEKNEERRTSLNNDDFLKLFVTSLQYQDPMSPMQNSEMMAQMAQMTMVEQTAKMSQSIEKLEEVLTGTKLERGVSFLGRNVTVDNGDGSFEKGRVESASVNIDGIVELLINEKTFQIGQIAKVDL